MIALDTIALSAQLAVVGSEAASLETGLAMPDVPGEEKTLQKYAETLGEIVSLLSSYKQLIVQDIGRIESAATEIKSAEAGLIK